MRKVLVFAMLALLAAGWAVAGVSQIDKTVKWRSSISNKSGCPYTTCSDTVYTGVGDTLGSLVDTTVWIDISDLVPPPHRNYGLGMVGNGAAGGLWGTDSIMVLGNLVLTSDSTAGSPGSITVAVDALGDLPGGGILAATVFGEQVNSTLFNVTQDAHTINIPIFMATDTPPATAGSLGLLFRSNIRFRVAGSSGTTGNWGRVRAKFRYYADRSDLGGR